MNQTATHPKGDHSCVFITGGPGNLLLFATHQRVDLAEVSSRFFNLKHFGRNLVLVDPGGVTESAENQCGIGFGHISDDLLDTFINGSLLNKIGL